MTIRTHGKEVAHPKVKMNEDIRYEKKKYPQNAVIP